MKTPFALFAAVANAMVVLVVSAASRLDAGVISIDDLLEQDSSLVVLKREDLSFDVQDGIGGEIGQALGEYCLVKTDKGLRVFFSVGFDGFDTTEYESQKEFAEILLNPDLSDSESKKAIDKRWRSWRTKMGFAVEPILSSLADSIASRRSELEVSWEALVPEYDAGLFEFRYGDPIKGNAYVLHKKEKYFSAGQRFEGYARKINDPYYLCVAGEEYLYAAEFQKKNGADKKALSLFEEGFKAKGGLDHLFRIQYAIAQIRLGLKNRDDLNENDTGAISVSGDPPREELFRRYISWY